jgi:tetratricopeptide (TPR) repeat protein
VNAEERQRDKEYRRAARYYAQALSAGFDGPIVRHRYGEVLLKLKDYAGARREFEVALSMDPCFLPTTGAYIAWLAGEGHFDRCMSLLNELPKNLADWALRFEDGRLIVSQLRKTRRLLEELTTGVRHAHRGELHAGLRHVWSAFRIAPTNCAVVWALMSLLNDCGWLHYWEKRVEGVVGKKSRTRYLAHALALFYAGHHEEAFAACTDAVKAGVASSHVSFARGLCLRRLGKDAEAVLEFTKVNAGCPGLPAVRVELVACAFEAGDYATVLQLGDVPHVEREFAQSFNVDGLRTLARIENMVLRSLCHVGEAEQARRRLAEQQLQLNDASMRLAAAIIHAALGEWGVAEEELARALELREEIAALPTEMEAALIERIGGEVAGARHATFAWAIYPAYRGDSDLAAARLRQYLSRFPGEARAWRHIGKIALGRDDFEAAQQAYEQSVDLQPTDEAIDLLAYIIAERKNLEGLLALADRLHGHPIPLEYAVRLALETGDPRTRDLARTLAERGFGKILTGGEVALALGGLEINVRDARDALTYVPFLDFLSRHFLASRLLTDGSPKESRDAYKSLLLDGNAGVEPLLFYGLACLASRPAGA